MNIDGNNLDRGEAHGTGTSLHFRDTGNNFIEARYY